MLQKLASLVDKYDELTRELSDPALLNDPQTMLKSPNTMLNWEK